MKVDVHFIDVTDFSLPDGTASGDWLRGSFERLGLTRRANIHLYDWIAGDQPDPRKVSGSNSCLIISGSYGPVFAERKWIPPLLDFIRSCHGAGAWILGICFGQHAVALALGGDVKPNPRGREMGSVPVFLTPEGKRSPLFKGFTGGGFMNIVHKTYVSRLPEGAIRLAFNRMTPVQAFSTGRTFGLQPHPEITPVQLEQLTLKYKDLLIRREKFVDDERHLRDFISSFRETPEAMSILSNFVEMVRE